MIRIFIISLAMTLLASFPAYAGISNGADGGGTDEISISLVGADERNLQLSEQNFFSAFDGIVPGETRKQDLVFTNVYGQSAEFYIWSEETVSGGAPGSSGGSDAGELARRMDFKLMDGDSVLYHGSLADEIRRLKLCTLGKDCSSTISMYLTMPADIDSRLGGQTVSTRWYVGVDVRDIGSGDDNDRGGSDGSGSGDASYIGGPGAKGLSGAYGAGGSTGSGDSSGLSDAGGSGDSGDTTAAVDGSVGSDGSDVIGDATGDAGYVIIGYKYDSSGSAASSAGDPAGADNTFSFMTAFPWILVVILICVCVIGNILLKKKLKGSEDV